MKERLTFSTRGGVITRTARYWLLAGIERVEFYRHCFENGCIFILTTSSFTLLLPITIVKRPKYEFCFLYLCIKVAPFFVAARERNRKCARG